MRIFDGDALAVSRYYTKFKEIRGAYPPPMSLKGDAVLVERLPPLELKKGSLIIATVDTHRDTMKDALTNFGLVLMTGPGQVFENGQVYSCQAEPGNIVLLPGGMVWYSQFGHIAGYETDSIGLVRDYQLNIVFDNYKKAFDILNG